jgi:acetyl-CoA synthetase
MVTCGGEEALAQVQTWLHTYGSDDVSVADLLCDRHADGSGRIALQYEDDAGRQSRLTFEELSQHSSRFAAVLRDLGIGVGDRVATLLPKTPELLITTLAIWRLGAVHVPLFTAFGPQAISYRVADSNTAVLVTNETYRPRIEDPTRGSSEAGDGRTPLRIVTVESASSVASGDVPFWSSLRRSSPIEAPVPIRDDDLVILIYTSGTTGNPKGVEVPAKALASFEAYMRFGYDLRPDDVYWNIADPGWAYGLYYALIGPLLCGNTTLFLDAPFDTDRVYQTFERYGITNFAAAPTVYRALRAAGQREGLRGRLRLRNASSAGEPLNPDVIAWAREQLGVPIFDHYGQSEHGMLVNNHHVGPLRRPLRPGSMGHPMPGFRVVILDDDDREAPSGHEGQLAVDVRESPLYWFRGYYNAPDRTAERFSADGRY